MQSASGVSSSTGASSTIRQQDSSSDGLWTGSAFGRLLNCLPVARIGSLLRSIPGAGCCVASRNITGHLEGQPLLQAVDADEEQPLLQGVDAEEGHPLVQHTEETAAEVNSELDQDAVRAKMQAVFRASLAGVEEASNKIIDEVLIPHKLHQSGVFLTPRKGFILFGPAGTGKTRLAVKTCDALGLPEKQRFFIRSAEVISKSPDASTKKLDEYFKPAVDAYESKGYKAETYVYVFDEHGCHALCRIFCYGRSVSESCSYFFAKYYGWRESDS